MSGNDESCFLDGTVAVLVIVAEVRDHCYEGICKAWYSSRT